MRIDRVKFAAELVRQDRTLVSLSEMTGLSRATLTSIKTGKSCRDETALKVARALGVPLERLV